MTANEKKLLMDLYKKPNEKLFQLINKRFIWND